MLRDRLLILLQLLPVWRWREVPLKVTEGEIILLDRKEFNHGERL